MEQWKYDLNTSYVTVQLATEVVSNWYILNLNTSYVTVQREEIQIKIDSLEFKYILCYCSTRTFAYV